MFTVSRPRAYTHEYTLLVFDAVTRHGDSSSPVSPPYRSVALEDFQRLVNHVTKLDRTVHSCFLIADRIFNMLEIQADHSLTAQSDYRRVAMRLIERTRKLNIFLHYPRCCNWYNLSILGTTVGPTGCVRTLTAFSNSEYWALSDMKYTLLHISSNYGYHFTFKSFCFSSISLVLNVIS